MAVRKDDIMVVYYIVNQVISYWSCYRLDGHRSYTTITMYKGTKWERAQRVNHLNPL